MILAKAPLWDIAEHPIFFLGTLHFGPFGGISFPRFADALVGSQEVAYFELDPFASRDMRFMLRQASNQTSLAHELGEPIYRRLMAEQLPLKHPLDAHVAGAVAELIEFVSASKGPAKYSEDWGVDRAVCARYYRQKGDVRFLETDALQGQAVILGPLSEIVAELESWRANGQLPRSRDDLLLLYQAGDYTALGELRKKIAPLRPTRTRAMLLEREARWIEKVKEIAASGRRTLVAVGVLHLPGDDGLLAQLRKAGYTVRFLGDY